MKPEIVQKQPSTLAKIIPMPVVPVQLYPALLSRHRIQMDGEELFSYRKVLLASDLRGRHIQYILKLPGFMFSTIKWKSGSVK